MKKITAVMVTVSMMAGASFAAQAAGVAGVGVGANLNAGVNASGANIGANPDLNASARANGNPQGVVEQERGLVRAGERASDNAHLPAVGTSGYGAAQADGNSADKEATRARAKASVRGAVAAEQAQGAIADHAPSLDADTRASGKVDLKAK